MASSNWHWKSKVVTPWAKTWFQQELKLSVKDDAGQQVSVTDVEILDGDVELGQRKSKLIAIYDVHIKLTWSGKAKDGSDVDGKLDIPEVSHEITLDKLHGYTYSWELASPASEQASAILNFAKLRLVPDLEAKFDKFPSVLMSTHGKDITVSAPNSQEPSRSGTPVALTSLPPAVGGDIPPSKIATQKGLNTTVLTVECNFMASADDMFSILTDEKRIPAWSHNSAVSYPSPGSSYSLFGGGVKGSYSSVSAPNRFAQTWALQHPNWPSGHFATLTTTLDQSSDSTKVTWTMTGVPIGLQDEIQRNLQGYYIGGLKSIGYVPISFGFRPGASSPTPFASIPPPTSNTRSSSWGFAVTCIALLAALVAILVPSYLHYYC